MIADSGARFANGLVFDRSAHHEIRIGLADLCAVDEESDVLGIGMTSALFEAVAERLDTKLMTGSTLVDAGCDAVSRHLLVLFAHA